MAIMKKFICQECGYKFDEPSVIEERHGFTHGPFERFEVCPGCNEPGYDHLYECDICGNPVPMSDTMIINHGGREMRVCMDDFDK